MWSLKETRTFGAAIARIVPGEGLEHPHAVGVGNHILRRFEAEPNVQATVVAGLLLLQARDFVHLSPEEQDETLRELEGHPSVALLIRLCVEGFYTSAAGLKAVGFRVTA